MKRSDRVCAIYEEHSANSRMMAPERAVPPGASLADLDLEVDAALREALWLVFVSGAYGTVTSSPAPQISPGLREALRRSLVDSAAQGVRWSGSIYLLDAVLADPQEGAYRLLTHCHIEPQLVLAAAHRATATPVDDRPRTPMTDILSTYDVISPPDRSPTIHLISRIWGGYLARRSRATPILHRGLELEAVRQAIQLAHPQVTTAHLLLAVLSLDEQLAAAQVRLPDALLQDNAGGEILAAHGVTHHVALQHLAQQPTTDLPVASVPPGHQRFRRTLPHHPMWTGQAADASTSVRAPTDSQAPSGSTQLLLAALANLDDSAAQLLRHMGADPAAILSDGQHRTATKPRPR